MKGNYKDRIYMFDGDKDSVYLSNVVTDPDIQVGEKERVLHDVF